MPSAPEISDADREIWTVEVVDKVKLNQEHIANIISMDILG